MTSRKILILAAVLLAGASAARAWPWSKPSPDELLIRDSDSLVLPKILERAGLDADLRLLERALKTAYAGREPDDDLAFKKMLAELEDYRRHASAKMLTVSALDRLTQILGEFPDQRLLVGVVGRPDYGTSGRLRLLTGLVGKNVAAGKDRPWDVGKVPVAGKWVPVVAITDFAPSASKDWKGFLDAARATLDKAPAVIVDLRGAGGGDETVGMELAGLLSGGNPPPVDAERAFLSTPEALALALNARRLSAILHERSDEPVPADDARALAEAAALYARAKDGGVPARSVVKLAAAVPPAAFPAPVLVLTDRETFAAGESVALALRGLPTAKLVGDNTRGALNFAEIGLLVLHHSQILIELAAERRIRRDAPRNWEKAGIPPDVRVPAGTDALKAAADYLTSAYHLSTH